MAHTYPIQWAVYHLVYIIAFISIMGYTIFNFIYEYHDPTTITYKVMLIAIDIALLIGCIQTGIQLKKRKITYKD